MAAGSFSEDPRNVMSATGETESNKGRKGTEWKTGLARRSSRSDPDEVKVVD